MNRKTPNRTTQPQITPANDPTKHQLLQSWFEIKERRHHQRKFQKINEGEVWWTAVGENIGVEINGKSEYFSRPVIIFKKLSNHGFMGIPLTSQFHSGSWYVQFPFQDQFVYAVLSQARVFSVKRLYDRIGQIDGNDLARIKSKLRNLYLD